MRALHAALGDEAAEIRDRRWRARTESLSIFLKAKTASPEERIIAIECRLGELEDALEERDARIDQLSRELRELRDLTRPRRAG